MKAQSSTKENQRFTLVYQEIWLLLPVGCQKENKFLGVIGK